MEEDIALFTNPQIDISGLPQVDQMEMIPLEPAYKTVRYIGATVFSSILILIAFSVALFNIDWGWYVFAGFGLVFVLAVWNVIYSGLAFSYMGYAVREKDISFQNGWLWKSMTTVPYNRVQHCDIKQGLLDRQFGLSRLTIYTAGGQSTDLMVPGLLPDTAEKLKTFILRATELSIENE